MSLAGTFSGKDTALSFHGAIAAPAGGIHLDFKIFQGASDQTDRFALAGAAPGPATTYWDVSKDAELRLINRSAPAGSYTLLLVAVDDFGISDSIRIPFEVATMALRYPSWTSLKINLSVEDGFGVDLDKSKLVSSSEPSAGQATFFLTYRYSTSSVSSYFWMELASPAQLNPPLPSEYSPNDDVRFLVLRSLDTSLTPLQVKALLDSSAPLESFVGLTPHQAIALTTKSGLIGRFVVDSLLVNQTKGLVRLKGAIARPL